MASARQSVPISAFPEDLHDLLRSEIDLDQSGGIGVSDLKAMVVAYKKQKQQVSFLKWVTVGGGVALLLMSAATFGVSLAAAEFAKDASPNTDGVMMVQSTGQPLRNAEFTLSSGVALVNSSSRRLQTQSDDAPSDGVLFHYLDVERPRVTEACNLFKQGAASNMNFLVEGIIRHLTVTSVTETCDAAKGASGGYAWTLDCPADSDICHGFVLAISVEQSRRLESGSRPLPLSSGTVICTHIYKTGRISQSEWEFSQAAGYAMPVRVNQGYRYWADVVVQHLEGNRNSQSEIIAEYFVKSYIKQQAWVKHSSLGEFSLTGTGIMVFGYPLCWTLGLLNEALPSWMLHLRVGTAHGIWYMASVVYHINQIKGALFLAVISCGCYSLTCSCGSKVKVA